eukprot:SAG11_NODE_157_length_14147_cov_8.545202_22_plen_98_part_00
MAAAGAYVIDRIWYSDDNGLSYQEAESNLTKMDEAQLVELPNGDLLANMRHQRAPIVGRGTSRSTDQVRGFVCAYVFARERDAAIDANLDVDLGSSP